MFLSLNLVIIINGHLDVNILLLEINFFILRRKNILSIIFEMVKPNIFLFCENKNSNQHVFNFFLKIKQILRNKIKNKFSNQTAPSTL